MKKFFAFALALAMVLSLCACGGNEPAPTQEQSAGPEITAETKYADTVIAGVTADLLSGDPYGDTTPRTEYITNMTFNTVVYVNPDTGEIEPELAKSWDHNDDNTEWTFYLQEGVTFVNGDKLTAEDVKFTYEYAANLNGATNVVKTFTAGSYAESVEVLDDYTIKFVLKNPMPDFPSYMEMKVYSKNAIETMGHAAGSEIGTGPYYLDKQMTVSGQQFVVSRNDNYWENMDPYKTEHIVFKIYGDENALVAAAQAGEVDFARLENFAVYNTLDSDPNLTVETKTGCASYYMCFNYGTKTCDWNNVELRQALCQIIDHNAIEAISLEGGVGGTVSHNFCAPSGLGYSANTTPFEYNPEAGAATLKAAGVTELKLIYAASTKKQAEVIQSCLEQAGIHCNIQEIDTTNWVTFKAAQDGYDIFTDYCTYRGALLYNYNRFLYTGGSSNVFGYSSKEYEAVQDAVSAQTSWEDMLVKFADLQQWVIDNVPIFPLCYANQMQAKLNSVGGGYMGGAQNADDWSTVYKVVE